MLDAKQATVKAIGRLGGPTKVAKKLGVSQQRVSYWKKKGKIAPEYVIPVVQELKDPQITEHILRPDVYPMVAA